MTSGPLLRHAGRTLHPVLGLATLGGVVEIAPGVTVGERFLLERKLGSGGFAIVWLARDLQNGGRPVALKILHPQGRAQQWTRDRFEREVDLLSRLDHPAIVRALWWQLEGESPILAMEFVPEATLHERLVERSMASRPWSVREAAALTRPLVEALEYAHGRGIIHRDLKPRNIMVGESGPQTLRLLDFGIARLVGRDQSDATTIGRVLGSLLYMAPEQLRGMEVDARVDVFAFGCILFELLTLAHPWARDFEDAPLRISPAPVRSDASNNYAAILERITRGPRPALSILRPELPVAVDALIARMLATSPAERFSSVRAAHDALLDLGATPDATVRNLAAHPSREESHASAGGPGVMATVVRALRRRQAAEGRHALAGLVVLAVLLLAAAVGVVFLRRPAQPASNSATPAHLAPLPALNLLPSPPLASATGSASQTRAEGDHSDPELPTEGPTPPQDRGSTQTRRRTPRAEPAPPGSTEPTRPTQPPSTTGSRRNERARSNLGVLIERFRSGDSSAGAEFYGAAKRFVSRMPDSPQRTSLTSLLRRMRLAESWSLEDLERVAAAIEQARAELDAETRVDRTAPPKGSREVAKGAAHPTGHPRDPIDTYRRRLEALEKKPDRDGLLGLIADLRQHIAVSRSKDAAKLDAVLDSARLTLHTDQVRRVIDALSEERP